ncbi:MAG TPA: endonuclease/exonuclease/phosphatase family protein [Rhodothermales bacterium]|nr:endonuclease/exonuclease/phosphatase family protein [Rhodothermales bacterium]
MGYTSPYLPPAPFWWTGLLAAVFPYLSAATLLSCVLALVLLGRRWLVPFSIVLILVLVRFLPPARLIGPEPEPSPADLEVMTFNAPVRGPNPDSLSKVTLRLIRKVNPDLLALQEPAIWIDEGRGRRATAHLQAVIDSLHYWAPTPRGPGSEFTIMQPVIARFPLGSVTQYSLSPRAGLISPTYVTRVAFSWKGRDAVLFNVHLHTTGKRKPWQGDGMFLDPARWREWLVEYRDAYLRRTREAKRLHALVEQERLPVIVMGDFNSTVHGWELQRMLHPLRDAFTERGEGWGGTYHARLPLFRIDHILVSPEWEVVTAYVPDMQTLSDHRPVVARLRWKE